MAHPATEKRGGNLLIDTVPVIDGPEDYVFSLNGSSKFVDAGSRSALGDAALRGNLV